jgi:hypothetical protein
VRTTIDIPDPLFRDVKFAAVRRGITLKELITGAIEKELRGKAAARTGHRIEAPLVKRKGRGSIDLTNAQIDDLLT